MKELINDPLITQIAALLTQYGFDLRGYTAQELISQWLTQYQAMWVRLAVVEALYQGRYKAVSVEQILYFWLRRGNPTFHFSHDFERLICRKLPRYFKVQTELEKQYLDDDLDLIQAELIDVANTTPNLEIAANHLSINQAEAETEIKPTGTLVIDIALEQEQKKINNSLSEFSLLTTQTERIEASNSEINLTNISASSTSIQQFQPPLDRSNFYQKLKAVIAQELEENEINQELETEN